MDTSPRNIRLSEDALNALKILKQTKPGTSISKIVSDAMVKAATGAVAAPIVRSALLDPHEYLSLQAEIAELLDAHQKIKKDILKIKPTDRQAAERIAIVIQKVESEITNLIALRQKLAKLAKSTSEITSDDVTMLIEQVAPTCRRLMVAKNPDDFGAQKNATIFRLIKTIFPEVEDD